MAQVVWVLRPNGTMKLTRLRGSLCSSRLCAAATRDRGAAAVTGRLCAFTLGVALATISAGVYDAGAGWLALSAKLGLLAWHSRADAL